MKRIFTLILAVIMCMAVFAGCANDGANGTETGTGTGAAVPATNGTIIVGYTDYAPMNYKDDSGELIGFDTELAKAVFAKLGYEVIFQEIVWDNRYMDLESGTIDCIWNGFTANTADDDGVKRADKVDFSYNYMENRQAVVVKKGAGIASAADMNGKFVVAESSSAGQSYAETFEGVNFKGFIKQTECLTEVLAGTADAAVVDVQLAKSYVGQGDYADLEIIESLSSDLEYYAIGFKKGSELTAKVNAQLEALAADGTIAKLAEKYGLSNPVITDFSSQK